MLLQQTQLQLRALSDGYLRTANYRWKKNRLDNLAAIALARRIPSSSRTRKFNNKYAVADPELGQGGQEIFLKIFPQGGQTTFLSLFF